MKNTSSYLLTASALWLLVVTLGGCASSPSSKFYQVSAASGQAAEARDVPRQGSEVISIGPLRVPDYLDRSQIVTRSGKNEIKLAEFDRWAGSIEDDIIRALVEDISAQLPPGRFFVIRWSPLLDSQLSSSYRVEMIVSRFEGALDGAVTLKAQWGILGKDKSFLFRKESLVVEQVNGNGYDAYVNAMSRAIERLSREIADGIVSKAAI
jgi:uncharacterized lipoprotein YmbA